MRNTMAVGNNNRWAGECFCFKQQPFKSGETKEFPVVFVINPKLPQDVHTITLSYTFFEVAGAAAMVAQ